MFLSRPLASPWPFSNLRIPTLHCRIRLGYIYGDKLAHAQSSASDYWHRAFRTAVLPAIFGIFTSLHVQEAWEKDGMVLRPHLARKDHNYAWDNQWGSGTSAGKKDANWSTKQWPSCRVQCGGSYYVGSLRFGCSNWGE